MRKLGILLLSLSFGVSLAGRETGYKQLKTWHPSQYPNTCCSEHATDGFNPHDGDVVDIPEIDDVRNFKEMSLETVKDMDVIHLHYLESYACEDEGCNKVWVQCNEICRDYFKKAFDNCHRGIKEDKEVADLLKEIVDELYKNEIVIEADTKPMIVYPFRSAISHMVWAVLHGELIKFASKNKRRAKTKIVPKVEMFTNIWKTIECEQEERPGSVKGKLYEGEDLRLFTKICREIALKGGFDVPAKKVSLSVIANNTANGIIKQNVQKVDSFGQKKEANDGLRELKAQVEKGEAFDKDTGKPKGSWLKTLGKVGLGVGVLGLTILFGKKFYNRYSELKKTQGKVNDMADKANEVLENSNKVVDKVDNAVKHPGKFMWKAGKEAAVEVKNDVVNGFCSIGNQVASLAKNMFGFVKSKVFDTDPQSNVDKVIKENKDIELKDQKINEKNIGKDKGKDINNNNGSKEPGKSTGNTIKESSNNNMKQPPTGGLNTPNTGGVDRSKSESEEKKVQDEQENKIKQENGQKLNEEDKEKLFNQVKTDNVTEKQDITLNNQTGNNGDWFFKRWVKGAWNYWSGDQKQNDNLKNKNLTEEKDDFINHEKDSTKNDETVNNIDAPRTKVRGIDANDSTHSSPGLKATETSGYSGQVNKNEIDKAEFKTMVGTEDLSKNNNKTSEEKKDGFTEVDLSESPLGNNNNINKNVSKTNNDNFIVDPDKDFKDNLTNVTGVKSNTSWYTLESGKDKESFDIDPNESFKKDIQNEKKQEENNKHNNQNNENNNSKVDEQIDQPKQEIKTPDKQPGANGGIIKSLSNLLFGNKENSENNQKKKVIENSDIELKDATSVQK